MKALLRITLSVPIQVQHIQMTHDTSLSRINEMKSLLLATTLLRESIERVQVEGAGFMFPPEPALTWIKPCFRFVVRVANVTGC